MALVVDGPPGGDGPELIASRYRIEGRIAKGGMGAVYRVFDETQRRTVALKRLADSGDRRKLRMFEREFHTLAGLKHPRIIEVYDYGRDEQGAYYTMELLDGRDLRELAPLPFQVACRYLRDVASSLALLHARNLLHRDLSPRNVRITSDDRAKLIDFGALSGFGRSATVVGTPPLVAPEVLSGAQLDQRTDLYAIGALAYWVLTGEHAYDVHAIAELPAAFARPVPPPSARLRDGLPAIPQALDDLVLALLSQNPLARPSCAAEVIARLSAIADLPAEREPLFALSYLHGGATVGRARERAQLRKRAKSALTGEGSLVMLEARAGMGSARILAELATEARLLGATAVLVDAALHPGSYGVIEQVVHALLAAHPEKARAAMSGHEPELERFLPGTGRRPAESRPHRLIDHARDPREARLRTQGALLGWIERLTQEMPLVVAVRSFHGADESSAALLAALASGISQRRALLAFAYDPEAKAVAPAAIASLRELGLRLELRGLSRDEVRALVETTFGEVPHTERLAGWLHELTQGKPQACLDLLQHLIETDVIGFIDGVWALPQELALHELPSTVGQALDARVARLSEDARRLALALCVERAAIPIERALRVAELERVAAPFRALTELEQRGVLVADDDSLRFAHRVVLEAARRRLDEAERKRLHAQLGALIASEGGGGPDALLDAGWHLMHGGQERRGADLLAEAGVQLSFEIDSMPAAIPALEAALGVFHAQRRSRLELCRLLAPLTICGFYTDRRVMETHGERALALLRTALGMRLAERLRPLLGPKLALSCGIFTGVVRCAFAFGPRRAARAYRDFMTLFVTATVLMTSLGTLTLDAPRARRYARMLEPLGAFGDDHAAGLNYTLTRAIANVTVDRVAQTLAECRRVLDRLDAEHGVRFLGAKARAGMLSAALYTLGSLETFREDPNALRIADRLEAMGTRVFEMFANQIRANYHGLRGEETLAEYYRRRVELFAIQAGSSWQAELWTVCSAILCYMLTADLVGLKRAAGQLARLSEEIPSLRLHAQLAQSAYRMVQGDAQASHDLGAPVMSSVEPRGYIGWSPTAASEIRNLVTLGEPERALQFGLRVLALYDADDRAVTTMITPIVIEVALAEAQLGRCADAARRIDDFLAELGERGGPATRGGLHEARARIALAAQDFVAAREHVLATERWFRPTGNSALIARCERLRRELEGDADGGESGRASDTLDLTRSAADTVRRALRGCDGEEPRWQAALDLLLEVTAGERGALFGYEAGTLVPRAVRDGTELPELVRRRLLDEARRHEQEGDGDPVTVATTGSGEHSSGIERRPARDADGYRAFLLAARDGAGRELVAIAAIAPGESPLQPPSQPLLTALAEALADAEPARDDANAAT